MISFWLHAISYIFIQKLVSQQKLTDQLDHKMSRNNQADAYRYGTLQDDENCAINFKHGTKDAIVPSITSPYRTLSLSILRIRMLLLPMGGKLSTKERGCAKKNDFGGEVAVG